MRIDLKSNGLSSDGSRGPQRENEATRSRAISRNLSTFFVKCHSGNGPKREIAAFREAREPVAFA